MIYSSTQIFDWILISASGLALLSVLTGYIITKKRHHITVSLDVAPIIKGLGGLDNIASCSARGSRLSVLVVNPQLINQEDLKECGVSSIIIMSKKAVLLLGDTAMKTSDSINRAKQSQT